VEELRFSIITETKLFRPTCIMCEPARKTAGGCHVRFKIGPKPVLVVQIGVLSSRAITGACLKIA
jgi:hypothetical protein